MEKRKKILVASFQSLSTHSGEGMARLGYFLSQELHSRGLLYAFIVSSKGKHKTPFPSMPVSRYSRYYLYLINRLGPALGIPVHILRYIKERLYDWDCARRVNKEVGAIVSTNAYLYRTFRKAKTLGIATFIAPANPEDNYIFRLVQAEQKRIGVHFTDAYTLTVRIKYYNRSVQFADKIICSTPVTYETYSAVFPPERIIHLPGHLPPDMVPAPALVPSDGREFHVAYLAYTVLLKGLQYLLEAWEQIMKRDDTRHMQLHIGGLIDPSLKHYIDKHYGHLPNVHYTGVVRSLAPFFQGKHLFVVPSLAEGGPVTALEAAHYGVPVVITRNSGARDFFEPAGNGMVIPICDAVSISEKILFAESHRKEIVAMGLAAKDMIDKYDLRGLVKKMADVVTNEL